MKEREEKITMKTMLTITEKNKTNETIQPCFRDGDWVWAINKEDGEKYLCVLAQVGKDEFQFISIDAQSVNRFDDTRFFGLDDLNKYIISNRAFAFKKIDDVEIIVS